MPSSSALTQEKLNWKPTGPGLIADLDGMDYTPLLGHSKEQSFLVTLGMQPS
jgi:hypothetical protein